MSAAKLQSAMVTKVELIFICAAILYSGCATTPRGSQSSAIADEWDQIHSITLLEPKGPAQIIVANREPEALAAAFGGLIGAAIGGSVADKNAIRWSSEFTERAGEHSIDVPQILSDKLKSSLQDRGYLKQISVRPDQKDLDLLRRDDFSKLEGSDAFLDVVVREFGYFYRPIDDAFIPRVIASLQIVSGRDHRVLLRRDFVSMVGVQSYKLLGVPMLASISKANPKYSFKTVRELMEKPADAIEGLRESASDVGDSMCDAILGLLAPRPKIYVYHEVAFKGGGVWGQPTDSDTKLYSSKGYSDSARSESVVIAVDDKSYVLKADDYMAVPVSIGMHVLKNPLRQTSEDGKHKKHKKRTIDIQAEEAQCYYVEAHQVLGGVKLKLKPQAEGEAAIDRIIQRFERHTTPEQEPQVPEDSIKRANRNSVTR